MREEQGGWWLNSFRTVPSVHTQLHYFLRVSASQIFFWGFYNVTTTSTVDGFWSNPNFFLNHLVWMVIVMDPTHFFFLCVCFSNCCPRKSFNWLCFKRACWGVGNFLLYFFFWGLKKKNRWLNEVHTCSGVCSITGQIDAYPNPSMNSGELWCSWMKTKTTTTVTMKNDEIEVLLFLFFCEVVNKKKKNNVT